MELFGRYNQPITDKSIGHQLENQQKINENVIDILLNKIIEYYSPSIKYHLAPGRCFLTHWPLGDLKHIVDK